MSAILLLTDGLPNVEPPRGTLPMLKRYKEQNGIPCAAIGTFGFGYSLDSALLEGIAKEGNGMYAFIPDASFVGTAFVNAVRYGFDILCLIWNVLTYILQQPPYYRC